MNGDENRATDVAAGDDRSPVTVADVQRMKADGRKSVCVVAWDVQLATIADRAGVDIVSVGDSVGVHLWGRTNPLEVTIDEMLLVASAVRRGVRRALVSCDFPFGPLQQGVRSTLDSAIRLVKEAGVDLVKLDGASSFPDAVEALERADIPVFAQFGITPQTAHRFGMDPALVVAGSTRIPDELCDAMIEDARRLEAAGSALLNLTNSGPVVGAAVVDAVSIPVLGGKGGGPWLDGRIRLAQGAIGYAAGNIDDPSDTYANVARTAFDALRELADDVREGRQIRGDIPPGGLTIAP